VRQCSHVDDYGFKLVKLFDRSDPTFIPCTFFFVVFYVSTRQPHQISATANGLDNPKKKRQDTPGDEQV
jgi:hypothetical protein